MAFKPFEKSGKDKEAKKFGKEGSKKEESYDKKQMSKAPAKRPAGRKC